MAQLRSSLPNPYFQFVISALIHTARIVLPCITSQQRWNNPKALLLLFILCKSSRVPLLLSHLFQTLKASRTLKASQMTIQQLLLQYLLLWWNRPPPPRDSVAWQRVYSSVLAAALSSSFKHLTHQRGCVMQRSILYTTRVCHAEIVIPEIYWFSRSCAIVSVIFLSHVVLPSSAAQYVAAPTLAALRRPAGQAFPLHASLRLSYRPIPTSSAPSDIPFVHSIRR